MQTAFTRLVGCAAPIQLAGMPHIATVPLAAAVAEAGALGMLGGAGVPAAVLTEEIGDLRRATGGAIGVTFLMPFVEPPVVALVAPLVRVVDFFYGEPDARLVSAVHEGRALAAWQVGSADEARAAADAGCDFVIAQGTEAGGHVRGRTSLLPLLDEVLEAVALPVLAAGGIASARDLAAVLAAGAAGARLGTRFVASAESGAHPDYVAALVAARAEDTVLCETFSGWWPDAPHRVLRSAVAALEACADEEVGEVVLAGERLALPRGCIFSPTRETRGRIAAMALYAGESVTQVRDVPPAGRIVAELVAGAEALLARAH